MSEKVETRAFGKAKPKLPVKPPITNKRPEIQTESNNATTISVKEMAARFNTNK